MTIAPESPISLSFCSTASRFRVILHCETNAGNDRVPNVTLLYSAASNFRVTGHFETSTRNDPRMIGNTTRLKVSTE